MKFRHFRFLLENYQATLKKKGVSDAIIRTIEKLPRQDRGNAIAKLMRNPSMKVDDLIVRDAKSFLMHKSPTMYKIVADADPTPDKRYFDIILWWDGGGVYDPKKDEIILSRRLPEQNIILPEDTQRVREVLEYYNKNKNRFKTKYITRYNSFHELEQEYLDVSNKRSKRQSIRDIKMKGSDKLYDDSEWTLWGITTPEAACYYGKGTRWCTAMNSNDSYAREYLQRGPLYIFLYKPSNEKYQVDADFEYFMDEDDQEVYGEIKTELVWVMSRAALVNNDRKYASELNYAIRIHATDSEIPASKEYPLDADMIDAFMKNSNYSLSPDTAVDIVVKWHDYQDVSQFYKIISTDYNAFRRLYNTYFTSSNTHRGSFGKDEIEKLKKMTWKELLKGGHNDPEMLPVFLLNYMQQTPNKEAEKILLSPVTKSQKVANAAYMYAKYILQERWPEGEEIIKYDKNVFANYMAWLKKDFGIDTNDIHMEYLLGLKNDAGLGDAMSLSIELNKFSPELHKKLEKANVNYKNVGFIMRYLITFKKEMKSVYDYITRFENPDRRTLDYLMDYQRYILGKNNLDPRIKEIVLNTPIPGGAYVDEFLNGDYTEWLDKMSYHEVRVGSTKDELYDVMDQIEQRIINGSVDSYSEKDLAPVVRRLEIVGKRMMTGSFAKDYIYMYAKFAVNIMKSPWKDETIHNAILNINDKSVDKFAEKYQEEFGNE